MPGRRAHFGGERRHVVMMSRLGDRQPAWPHMTGGGQLSGGRGLMSSRFVFQTGGRSGYVGVGEEIT
jgi:hypothetical protein